MCRPPPADERFARPERELLPLAGLEQQVVEAVEGDVGRLARGGEALPHPAGREASVVADDVDAVLLGLPDPLAGRLRDPLEGGLLVDARERQRDPMARRLDLLDRVEAGGARARPRSRVSAGISASAATTSMPAPARCIGDRDEARGDGSTGVAGGDRTARDVGAAAADERPRPRQGEDAERVVDDEVVRRPAARRAVRGPGPGLVDVAAGRIDRSLVPVGELVRGRGPDRQAASLPPSPPNAAASRSPPRPWRRRAHPTRPAARPGRPAGRADRARDPTPRCSGPRARRTRS